MSFDEKEKFYSIIKKNKKILGLRTNTHVMIYNEIKSTTSLIDRNIRISMVCGDLLFLKELKRLLEKESSFLEQFNF
jgi:hypothetical protein